MLTNIRKMKKIFLLSFLFSSLLAAAISIYYRPQSPLPKGNSEPLVFPKGSTYEKEWKKVDSLTNKGLTKSALETVEAIYSKAKKENNAPQIVKAVIHRIKLESYLEENAVQKSIDKLNAEVKDSKYPLSPVLHSVLAEMYWRYYQQNRWKFHNRTQTVNFDLNDLSTWDLKTIVDRTSKHYLLSLKEADSLKRTALNLYDDVLTHDDYNFKAKPSPQRKLRATLYDFLAHRAVDFFMNEEPDIIKPAYRFELNSESYFWNHNDFAKLKIENKDSLSLKFYAINILKDLIYFHNEDKDPAALIDADLKRLKFVKSKSTVELKDSLFLQALQNLEKKFISHPSSAEISYEIAQVYNEKGSKYNPLAGDEHKWEKKTALQVCEDAIKRFPESFGAANCRYLQAQIRAKSLSYNIEEGNLPDKPFRARVQYGNVNKIYLRIIKQDAEKFTRDIENLYGENLINKFLKAQAVKQWSLDLPDDKDYQTHSAEIKIDPLPLGHYVLLMGSSPDFSYEKNAVVYGNFFITGLSYIQRRTETGGYDFTVFHRDSGEPLKGVNAQLWYQHYNYTLRKYEYRKGSNYTTDENGTFTVSSPSSNDYRNYWVEFSKEHDKFYSTGGIYMYKDYKQEKKFYPHTYMFTDRAIYRPGQTVFFKGIMIESDGKTQRILAGRTEKAVLYDPNYQEAASVSLTTNEYGSFSGSFTLPQNLLNGQFRVGNAYGYAYFSVEDYKRPKFEVTFPPITGTYKLNENVEVKGKAQSYAGATISGAEVRYRVVRNATFPHYRYGWRGYYPSSAQMEITNGITTTNDTGGFVINFKALPDPSFSKKYSPLYTFTIYADVTDITGETHSNQNYVSVGYNALKMDVNIAGYVSKDSVPKYNIHTTNLNGEFEPAKVKVHIWKQKEPGRLFRTRLWEQADKHLMTKEEYYSHFPNDVYADEDKEYKWEKAQQVFAGEFQTDKAKDELVLNTISQWQDGAYILEAVTNDKFGEEVKDVKYFIVYSSGSARIPVNTYDWFIALKSNGEPGDKASFIIGTKSPETKVLFEIEHQNEIVKREWLVLNPNLNTIREQEKIEIPIEQKHRGNFSYHLTFVKNGRAYTHSQVVMVPHTDKQLDIEFETFRNKLLPGQKEEWKLKIKGKKGEKVAAEMLAAMYDASLDAFRSNNWYFNIYNTYYTQRRWETQHVARNNGSNFFSKEWNIYPVLKYKYYDKLNWFGHYQYGDSYGKYRHNYESAGDYDGNVLYDAVSAMPAAEEKEGAKNSFKVAAQSIITETTVSGNFGLAAGAEKQLETKNGEDKSENIPGLDNNRESGKHGGSSLGQISARKNLNETSFFYPILQTDENGNVIIKFTTPEALTKWKVMGLAHTKDLKYGQIEKEVITQKELMVTPHAPRFFRENDNITFTAKVDNLSSADMNGKAELILYDALSMKDITHKIMLAVHGQFETIGTRNFTAKKGQSASLEWDLIIPEGLGAITYKVVAKAGNFTDGEENAVPVLTNRMLVTESLPLPIRSKQTKTFKFEKFISQNNGSSTLRNHKLTLEFTANPAWYAVQALPYMMEYPYECAEQTFSRFYANSIASHIANSSPKIKAVFESWKSSSPDAFLSNLQKNQELKSLMLEETPWVLEAKDESERKKRVGLLFDLNKMANELESALNKLQKIQVSNGGWPWFEGMPDSRYITQHIVTGMGHLDHLGVKRIRENIQTWNMVKNAVRYLDNRIREDYEWILKHDKENINKDHLWYEQIQYLYARSYFKDIPISANNQKAFEYYKGQAQKYWLGKGRYMNGMIALGLHRYGDKEVPLDIMKSLKENSLVSEELGMYWKENYEGFYWYEAPIESQALLIEAFDEVANDKKAVDDLRIWLLKSKQTQDWKSTKATTEAVFALLLRGTDWLATESNVEISLGELKIDQKNLQDTKIEAGTGYFKTSWSGSNIKPQMGNVSVSKKDEGVSWGAVYWQYFEQLDKITPHKTPLQLVKKLFIEKNTPSGPVIEPVTESTKLKPGDKLKVRIELRVDRDMEYVHMKDMRASGFEPVNVFSRYKYQDGLGYYESTRDAATNFFFDRLPKGTYVFEYPLVAAHAGDFSNGITTIQCMYAPEFTSHSEGIRVKVQK